MCRLTVSLAFVLVSLSSLAGAEETISQPAMKERDRGEVLVAVKAGGLVARGFSQLTGSYLVDVELGYALPVLKHRLALTLDAAFTAPQASGTQTDPRIDGNGGTYGWKLEQRELIFGLTLIYRHPIGRLTPYIGVGPRLFLLQSKTSGGVAGTAISTSAEQSTKVGAGIPLGLGFRLWRGDLFVEVALNISPIDHTTTGDSNTGSLSCALGYRLFL